MGSNMPLVSVIMNCYNSEKYLREAIDSVYAQSYSHWEIIFWDNASTDNSAAIANSYDSRLKYFRGTVNVPLGAARNLALNKAEGEYIAFLDCDDIWLPNKIETQIAAMATSDYSLCYAGVEEFDESGSHLRNVYPAHKSGYMFPDLLNQFDINMVTPLIRRKTLVDLKLRFEDSVVASEEYNLFMRLSAKTKFCAINEILGRCRVRSNSLTEKSISRWASERFFTIKQIMDENPGIDNTYALPFREAMARGWYYSARYQASLGNRLQARIDLRNACHAGFKYWALYVLLFLPLGFWKFLHKPQIKRSAMTRLLTFAKTK